MKSFADFESIRVINLAHRTDRRAEMGEQLARVGLALDSPNVSLFAAVRPQDAGGFESIGAHGCFMSHLGILREAAGSRNVLIFEDDLDFADEIADALSPVLGSLPSTWGVFYGGCVTDAMPGSGPTTEVAAQTPIRTSHFVAFNGSVIGALVEYLERILGRPPGHPDGGPMHVDGAYSRFRADNPRVRTFVAIPELGHQRASRTDIHALRWFDRTPFVRNVVQRIRRRRARDRG